MTDANVPHGVQGFASANEAYASAIAHKHKKNVAILRRGNEYAWVHPIEHAISLANSDPAIHEIEEWR